MLAPRTHSILLLLWSLLVAGSAEGASRLTSAPHFLSLSDRDRIVLFSDGPVAGALADRHADGTVEVVIPRVAVAETIAGREFDDAAAGGDGKLKVRVSDAGGDDVRVRIASARPVTRVHAFASSNPARLTIDLLHGDAPVERRDVRTAPRPAAASASGDGAGKAGAVAQSGASTRGDVPARASSAMKSEPEQIGPPRSPADDSAAASAPAPEAVAASAPAVEARAASAPALERAGKKIDGTDRTTKAMTRAGDAGVGAAAAPAVAPAVAAAHRPPAAPSAAAQTGGLTATVAATDDPEAVLTGSTDPVASDTLVCRWRRSSGVAYCAPDPKAGVYVADLGTANLAGLLDRGRSGPTAVPLPPSGPTEVFLNADVALLRGAREGWILPAVSTYEQALRTYPDFADAARARANLALVYYALGFAPELDRMSRRKDDVVAPFAGVLLADLWRQIGEQQDTAPLLAAGDRAGGITACLAERARANAAAEAERRDAFPAAFASLAKVCPRTILEDSETAWLRARAMILGGEATRAADALPPLEEDLPKRQRPLLLADLVRAQDAAGDARAARRVEERLAAGSHGRRASRTARVALAARDAAEGKLAPTERRFADLPIEDALQTRERADLIAASEMLRGGNEVAALGLMTERKLDPRRLAVSDQLLLARALRRVGLLDPAQGILAGIGTTAPARLPDAYFEELGALALTRDDADAALAVADRWEAARSETAPVGAIALRARARGAKGDARGATETLKDELAPRDPELAREVAVELASELLSADPALALSLARGALDPALPPLEGPRAADALRALAEAAEATGDPASARAAFATLAQEHAGEPAAAGAGYRASRLASAAAPAGEAQVGGAASTAARPASAPAAAPPTDDDPLARRLAAVGRIYDEVVATTAGGARP